MHGLRHVLLISTLCLCGLLCLPQTTSAQDKPVLYRSGSGISARIYPATYLADIASYDGTRV